MEKLKEVYIGLGGNIGDAALTLQKALERLSNFQQIQEMKVSKFYQTTPVSEVPQSSYINAVCFFKTTFSLKELFENLQQIERDLGKVAKPKNHPRVIDLDILFFGQEMVNEEELIIPHPRWHERLFVLIPLSEITEEIKLLKENQVVKININSLLKEFSNINQEKVVLFQ